MKVRVNNNFVKFTKTKKADVAKRERIRNVKLNLEMIRTPLPQLKTKEFERSALLVHFYYSLDFQLELIDIFLQGHFQTYWFSYHFFQQHQEVVLI